jgi:hypothetical protein
MSETGRDGCSTSQVFRGPEYKIPRNSRVGFVLPESKPSAFVSSIVKK